MRSILFSGVPASGKTTIIKEIINQFGGIDNFEFIEEGLVKYHKIKNGNLIVFGVFKDMNETFVSTDKWSMAVQPVLIEWIVKNKDSDYVCIGEGDRIFTSEIINCFIKNITSSNFRTILLNVEKDILKDRHLERKDNQNDKFLKSKETKYKNLQNEFEGVEILKNNSKQDFSNIVSYFIDNIKFWKQPENKVRVKQLDLLF